MNEALKGPMGTAGGERRPEVLTLPNLLSLSRILLTPVFIGMMVQKRPWAAFFVFLAAGATDALDGFAARKLHLRSTLGLWLDPAGDKVLLTSAFVVLTLPALAQPNTLPLWLTGICIGRDVAIALAALVIIALRGKQTFAPVLAGKASTICQVLVLYFVLYSNAAGRSPQALAWLYVLTALLTCVSWIQYAFRGIALLRGRRKNAS
jgi:cardiolipin synthase (CMP-forming)